MEENKKDLSSLRIDRSRNYDNPSSGKKKVIIITTAVLAIVLVAVFVVVIPDIRSQEEVSMVTARVQTPAQSNAVFTASGYVVAQRKAAVASKGTGRLVYLGVVEGDKVKKDEIIAKLEDNDVKAQLAEAKANLQLQEAGLTQAKNNFDRESALFSTGSGSQASLDIATANYKQVLASIEVAKAGVQAAEVSLENTVIRAPFDGTVLTKNADVGEIVAPLAAGVNSKAAVVTIADMKSLQVEADVSESNIERITPDQECKIVLDAYPSHEYPGYVAKIVPTADRSKATVMVKVGFKSYDKRVLPEMSAKVLFMSGNDNKTEKNEEASLVVPNSAVAERNGGQVVFEVRDNQAVEIPVKTGRKFDSYTEILSGIKDGDKVIGKVTDKIKNGTKVKAE